MDKLRNLWHNLTHRHMEATKGPKWIYVCASRLPWGGMVILYRPNEHIEPFVITSDQLKRVLADQPLYVDMDKLRKLADD